MFTLRRLYLTATTTGKRTVVSPGARAPRVSGSNGSSSSASYHRSPSSTHPPPPHRRRIESYAVLGMIVLASAWVLMLVGMLAFYGTTQTTNRLASTTTTTTPESLQLVRAVQKEPSQTVLRSSHTEVEQAEIGDIEEPKEEHGTGLAPGKSPLLIFTCHRANYLQDTLADVLRYIPNDCSIGCPVIISQDGKDPEVANVITKFGEDLPAAIPLVHYQHTSKVRKQNPYQALAQHYGWALQRVFSTTATSSKATSTSTTKTPFERVIILEEDLHIAPDFFRYFQAMAPLLDTDPTLLAVSAFNDNGFTGRVMDPTRVLRSDFFPGLGWMLNRRVYEQLPPWPAGYWDDWLREPSQRQNRHVVRPEISRTFHFGTQHGASSNQFGNHLAQIHLATASEVEAVDWTSRTATGTATSAAVFQEQYIARVEAATEIDGSVVVSSSSSSKKGGGMAALQPHRQNHPPKDLRIAYHSWPEFQRYARAVGLMDDEKAGIPRTAYEGIVETRPFGDEQLLFLVPEGIQSTV